MSQSILIPGDGRLITVTIAGTTSIAPGSDSRVFTQFNALAQTLSNAQGESAELSRGESLAVFSNLRDLALNAIVMA